MLSTPLIPEKLAVRLRYQRFPPRFARYKFAVSVPGPVYDVQLIESLPLGGGDMVQQMPSREDLMECGRRFQRVAAGYEVLLHHYHVAIDAINKIEKASEEWRQSQ